MATTTELDFSVMRGEPFKKGIVVTLDQSRTLDGSEDWEFTARVDATTSPVIELSKSAGTIEVTTVEGQANMPQLFFKESSFSGVTIAADDLVLNYDLQMTKDGNKETVIPRRETDGTYTKGKLTVVMDMTQ